MPIDYKKYPPSWKTEIRPRILARAKNKCEFCGVENGSIIVRNENRSHVVLTIAHLDQDRENWQIKDTRLAALCQRCHLQYDRTDRKTMELFA